MVLEIYNDTPQATHNAKSDFDCKMWVVWANSQLLLFLSFFLPFYFLFTSGRLQVTSADESSPLYAY